MLPTYFDYVFVHPRQKARLRPELSPKFLSTFGPNLARTHSDPKSSAQLTTLLVTASLLLFYLFSTEKLVTIKRVN